jgi:hypothetical protein
LAYLAAFAAVAEHLNFRVAASRVVVTPSALSRTMPGSRDSHRPIRGHFVEYADVHLELRINEARIDVVSEGFAAGVGPNDWPATDMIVVWVMWPMRVPWLAAQRRGAHGTPT